MADVNSDILKELQNISFLLGDLNFIRNGEYDPPTGSGSSGRPERSQPTPLDMYARLGEVVELLAEQNRLLAEFLEDDEDEDND
jgi:hypothetical protein